MSTNRRLLLLAIKALDLAVFAAAFVLAVATTQYEPRVEGWLPILEMRVKVQNVFFVLAYLGYVHVVLLACDLYRSYRLSSEADVLRDLALAVVVALAPLAAAGPLLDFEFVNTAFLCVFGGITFVGLTLERAAVRVAGRWARRHGRNLQQAIVVSSARQATATLLATLAQRDDLGYHVVEVIETDRDAADPGSVLARIEALLARTPIDEVFVALSLDAAAELPRAIIAACEEQGITVRVVAQLASASWSRATLDAVGGLPVVTLHTGPSDSIRLLIKRGIDLAGALAGLLVFTPVLVLVALLVKLDSPGPVFFVQERVGLNRRRFRAYKFRTMVSGAEALQRALESRNEADGPVFKIKNDPRVTRVGRWLRQLSIDELPQLFNVLRGDMSLVGPRPLPLRDVERIDVRWHKRRFSVKPGITCLWQINGRKPQFDSWIALDMQYIDNWSLALDFKILAKTIPAVLSREGAH